MGGPVYFDRVKETTGTTGTGTFTLAGAVTGYVSYASVYTAASTVVYYCATDGVNWEVGQGTFTLSGTTLTRTTVLASSNAGAAVSFPGPSTQVFVPHVARSIQQGFTINVCDFGALGNNSANDSTAVNAAIAAANAFTGLAGAQRGCRVYFPSGIYLLGSAMTTLTGNGIVLYGEGRGATTINVNFASGDLLNLGSGTAWNEVHNMQFNANVTRTSGAFINTGGANDVQIHDFAMTGGFQGINVSGSSIKVTIEHGEINATSSAASSASILVQNGSAGDTYIGPRIIMSNTSTHPVAGIQILQTGHCQITGCNITGCVNGLLINPGTSQTVNYVWVTDSLFDSSTGYGMQIDPSVNVATAIVRSVRCQSSWFSGSSTASGAGHGVLITAAGSSCIVDDIVFDNCRFLNNAAHGFELGFGTNVQISNSTIAGNSNSALGGTTQTSAGIHVESGITDFRIHGNRIGPVGTATNSQLWGIQLVSGATNRFSVARNDLRLNGTSGTSGGAFSNLATGLIKDIHNNVGGPMSGVGITSAVAITTTTETILCTAPFGSGGANPGTIYRFQFAGTATNIATSTTGTFRVRLGTAGTTADTSLMTFGLTTATTAGSAIPFEGNITITLRTSGTAGSVYGVLRVTSNAATGLDNATVLVVLGTVVTAPNTLTADNILSCSYAITNVTDQTNVTFQEVNAECLVAA